MAVSPAPDGEAVGEQSDSTDTTTTEPAPEGHQGQRGPLWILMALFVVVLVCLARVPGRPGASRLVGRRPRQRAAEPADRARPGDGRRAQLRHRVLGVRARRPRRPEQDAGLRGAGREVPQPQVRDHVRAERPVRRADRRPAAGHPRRSGLRRGSEHARGRLRPGAGGRHRLDLGAEPQEARRAGALLRADVQVRSGPGAHAGGVAGRQLRSGRHPRRAGARGPADRADSGRPMATPARAGGDRE